MQHTDYDGVPINNSANLLTGRSFGSLKNILMTISNSPHPVSVISYGGFVTTRGKYRAQCIYSSS